MANPLEMLAAMILNANEITVNAVDAASDAGKLDDCSCQANI